MLDKYKDMRKRKSNFGAIRKKYAQTCSTKTSHKTSYENNMSHLNSY